MDTHKYIYWLTKTEFENSKTSLKQQGYKLSAAAMTPCEVLKTKDNKLIYATPAVFNRVCTRQGSWYRNSEKDGKTMLVSDHRLAKDYDQYLEASMERTDFIPTQLPSRKQLKVLVQQPAYIDKKPTAWEKVGLKDKLMFKSLFTLTSFWGWGDNMKKHWLNQRANHANFLSKQYTVEMDQTDVAYSVTDNDGVCSSCVEFFNIIQPQDRKLVRACPGAITFGGAERQVYYDVLPVKYSEQSGNPLAANAS